MKFLWLDINASYSHSSLALPALHAQLGEDILKNCEWHSVQGTIKTNPAQIISQIHTISPHYIFATGWLFNIEYLLNILSHVHALQNNIGIILGGPEFLGDNQHFLRSHPFVCAVFKGEGEDMFARLISQLVHKEHTDGSDGWNNIPGFEYIQEDHYICSDVQTVKDFKALAIPEKSVFFNWEKAFVQIETSRGCFNNCRFCVSGIQKNKIQDLPVKELRSRLQTIKEHGIKEVRILDRTFNANPVRGMELLDLFAEFAGDIQFHIEVHPALLNPVFKEYLTTIPNHLLHVEAGIQSLQENVIAECKRSGKTTDAIAGLKYLLQLNKFEVHADLISGLPHYSYSQLLDDTLALMQIGPQEIQLELLKLLPGTYFRENSHSLHLKYSPVPPYEVLETMAISYHGLQRSMVLSKMIDYWYNEKRWRPVFTMLFAGNKELLEKFIGDQHGGGSAHEVRI